MNPLENFFLTGVKEGYFDICLKGRYHSFYLFRPRSRAGSLLKIIFLSLFTNAGILCWVFKSRHQWRLNERSGDM